MNSSTVLKASGCAVRRVGVTGYGPTPAAQEPARAPITAAVSCLFAAGEQQAPAGGVPGDGELPDTVVCLARAACGDHRCFQPGTVRGSGRGFGVAAVAAMRS
jgi:hypothetical protein